jgi:hypothetical protein
LRIKNALVVGVILLFIGVAVQPSIAVNPFSSDNEEVEIEPKDYLFQTIIDIANNPEIKELLEQYNHKIITSNYNNKGVFSKVLFNNPRLFLDMLFTKSSITYEYLNKCYNRGIQITNILGEEIVLDIKESIEVTNKELFIELNSIIRNNEELSDRIEILNEMNKESKPDVSLVDWQYPKICSILFLISLFILFCLVTLSAPYDIPLENSILLKIIQLVLLPFILPLYLIFGITVWITASLFLILCGLPWF